jgi:nucleotide-binding universal stress UspA family protein
MPTATATPATGSAVDSRVPVRSGPILIATDGTASADAAVRAAHELSRVTSAPVQALAVLEPMPMVAIEYSPLLPPFESEDTRYEALGSRVRAQLREIVGADTWGVEIRSGDPAAVIANTARELDARMIVVGLGHHDLLDRLFGGETALHALRLARTPVLAVPASFEKLPSRILVATDFSTCSQVAAHLALELLPGLTMVYLAHVAPRLDLQPHAYAAWMSAYGSGIEPAFARMREDLDPPAGLTVETITLSGKPSRALLDFAKSAHLDAIVAGSRGSGLLDRILVGSTATALIRGAQSFIFAVPAGVGMPLPGEKHDLDLPRGEWKQRLEQFTQRNAGRLAELEVDDPEIGAQAQQRGYPFLGAAYDHHDDRIEIMLGEQNSTRHLTRGITDVKSVDLLQDSEGRDVVLRIAHGSGQTILTLVR